MCRVVLHPKIREKKKGTKFAPFDQNQNPNVIKKKKNKTKQIRKRKTSISLHDKQKKKNYVTESCHQPHICVRMRRTNPMKNRRKGLYAYTAWKSRRLIKYFYLLIKLPKRNCETAARGRGRAARSSPVPSTFRQFYTKFWPLASHQYKRGTLENAFRYGIANRSRAKIGRKINCEGPRGGWRRRNYTLANEVNGRRGREGWEIGISKSATI